MELWEEEEGWRRQKAKQWRVSIPGAVCLFIPFSAGPVPSPLLNQDAHGQRSKVVDSSKQPVSAEHPPGVSWGRVHGRLGRVPVLMEQSVYQGGVGVEGSETGSTPEFHWEKQPGSWAALGVWVGGASMPQASRERQGQAVGWVSRPRAIQVFPRWLTRNSKAHHTWGGCQVGSFPCK